MRSWLVVLAAVSTLSVAAPALACGLAPEPRPIVDVGNASALLTEAARLETAARVGDREAAADEQRASRLDAKARELRIQARVAERPEREDLLALADTFEDRADALAAHARNLRRNGATLRARAQALREQARGLGGGRWRHRPIPRSTSSSVGV
jgi:hypothetical protein